MKLLLAVPRTCGPSGNTPFPIGTAYIASSLKAAGHEVACLNLNAEDEVDDAELVREKVLSFDPDVVASGTISTFYHQIKLILDVSRDAKPGVFAVAGGGVVTAIPERATEGLGVDAGAIGEAEQSMVELANVLERGEDPIEVAGFVHRARNGSLVRGPERKPLKDLSRLPWPDYAGCGLDRFIEGQSSGDNLFLNMVPNPRSVPMVLSRSCPYSCTFCFHPTGRVYRERPLDDFFAELEWLIENHGINMVELLDELMAYKRDRLEAFCARMKGYGINWWDSLHVSAASPDAIALMKDSGCVLISYGLESVHPDVLTSMRKKSTQEQIENALAITQNQRMAVRGNFIFGDPAETLESANHTLDWWARNRRFDIWLSYIQVLPGAKIHRDAVEKGIIEDDPGALNTRPVNLTAMNDATYQVLLRRILVFGASLLVPSGVTALDQDDGGPNHYRVQFECAHCRGENDYRDVKIDFQERPHSVSLICRSCGRFCNAMLPPPPPWPHADAEAFLEAGKQAIAEGREEDGIGLLAQSMTVFHGSVWERSRPDASIQAAQVKARILSSKGLHGLAEERLSWAICSRPFDPILHLSIAQELLLDGSYSAAWLHRRHARLLAGKRDDALGVAIKRLGAVIEKVVTPDAPPCYLTAK